VRKDLAANGRRGVWVGDIQVVQPWHFFNVHDELLLALLELCALAVEFTLRFGQ
jgi:hypothetical protein